MFTFYFGDGYHEGPSAQNNTTHVYSASGAYTLLVSATDGTNVVQESIYTVVQPQQACYVFQLQLDPEFSPLQTDTIVVSSEVPTLLYCRIMDPLDVSEARSSELTSLYASLGGVPVLDLDAPFVSAFQAYNQSLNAWIIVVTFIGGADTNFTKTSMGFSNIAVMGCLLRQPSYLFALAQFKGLNDSSVEAEGAAMLAAGYQPTSLLFSQDACSPNAAIMTLGSSVVSEGFGGYIVTTDDMFGATSCMWNLLAADTQSICFNRSSLTCASVVVLDIKLIAGGSLLALTSAGLVRGTMRSDSGPSSPTFYPVSTNVDYIDQGRCKHCFHTRHLYYVQEALYWALWQYFLRACALLMALELSRT